MRKLEEKKYIRKNELNRVLKFLAKNKPPHQHPKYYLAVLLASECGLRITEACWLRIEHFREIKDGILLIRSAKKRHKGTPAERPVVRQPVSDRATRECLKYFKWAKIDYCKQKGWLLPGMKGVSAAKPMCERKLHVIFTDACRQCSLPHKTFHCLRHYLGFRVARETRGDLTLVATILRHDDVNTAQLYVHRTPDELRAFVNKMRG